MAKTMLLAAAAASVPAISAASTTAYLAPIGSATITTTTEAEVQLKIREDGTLSNFGLNILSNGRSTATVFGTRKNSGAGSQSVSVGASATGRFEDTSNTDDLANNDLINYYYTTDVGTGSISWNAIGAVYAPDTGDAGYIGFTGTATLLGADRFYGFSSSAAGTVGEGGLGREIYESVTVSKLRAYVSLNTRTSATVFRTRKNTANGNLSVSIGALTTGEFEDTSNSDSLVATDDYGFNFDVAAGTGSLNNNTFQASINTSTSYLGCDRTTAAFNFGSTFYLPLAGDVTNILNAAQAASQIPYRTKAKNLFVSIIANTVNGSTTYTLRKGASNTSLAVSVGSSATGRFEDTDQDIGDPGSIYDIEVITGGSSGTQNARGAWVEIREAILTENDVIKGLAYSVTTEAALTKGAEYRVVSEHDVTKALAYTVLTEQAITKDLAYSVVSPAETTKGLAYAVLTQAEAAKGLQYAILSQSDVAKGLQYTVLTENDITKALVYTISQPEAITKDLVYTVTAPAEITKTTEYRVLTFSEITKAAEYVIAAGNEIMKTLAYRVVVAQALTKGLDYEVQSAAEITKGMAYRVITEAALTKGLVYTIASAAEITQSLQYVVISPAEITKALEYDVSSELTTTDITKALAYLMRVNPYCDRNGIYTEMTSPYSEKSSPYTPLPKKC